MQPPHYSQLCETDVGVARAYFAAYRIYARGCERLGVRPVGAGFSSRGDVNGAGSSAALGGERAAAASCGVKSAPVSGGGALRPVGGRGGKRRRGARGRGRRRDDVQDVIVVAVGGGGGHVGDPGGGSVVAAEPCGVGPVPFVQDVVRVQEMDCLSLGSDLLTRGYEWFLEAFSKVTTVFDAMAAGDADVVDLISQLGEVPVDLLPAAPFFFEMFVSSTIAYASERGRSVVDIFSSIGIRVDGVVGVVGAAGSVVSVDFDLDCSGSALYEVCEDPVGRVGAVYDGGISAGITPVLVQGSYRCSDCGWVGVWPSEVRKHIRVHVRPEACSYCPMKFATMSELKRHEASHRKARVAGACSCGLTFTRKDALVKHCRRTGHVAVGCGV